MTHAPLLKRSIFVQYGTNRSMWEAVMKASLLTRPIVCVEPMVHHVNGYEPECDMQHAVESTSTLLRRTMHLEDSTSHRANHMRTSTATDRP